MSVRDTNVFENELQRIQSGVFDAWRIYMTWYTWFFGANLIVLGWIFTKPGEPVQSFDFTVLALAWIVFNATGIVSTLRLRTFTMKSSANAFELVTEIAIGAGYDADEEKLTSNLGIPSELGNVGALANAFALSINIALWLYLAFNA